MGAWGPSSLRHFRALRDVLEFRVEDFRITDFGKVFVVSSGFLVVGVIRFEAGLIQLPPVGSCLCSADLVER